MYHIIKIVSYGVARPVGQVGQWAMAHLKGLGPHMNTLCVLFWFLPYLTFQEPKLPYHLCKRRFREESLELFLFGDGLEEAHWTDVCPLLKNFRFLPYQVPKLPYHLCKSCHEASLQYNSLVKKLIWRNFYKKSWGENSQISTLCSHAFLAKISWN